MRQTGPDRKSTGVRLDIRLYLNQCYDWCKSHPIWAVSIAAATIYWIGFRIYYCSIEGCTHPADWWFHLDDEPQAAWLGSLGALAAVWWGFFLFSRDRREKQELARKRVMPVAAALHEELQGVLQYFAALGAQGSQATSAFQVHMQKGSIVAIGVPKLTAAFTNPAFVESIGSDEADQLYTLLESIRRYNEFVGRQATSGSYGGPTAGDFLQQYEVIKCQVDRLRTALSKYRVLPKLESARA